MMNSKKTETMIDELRTMTTPPKVIHLDIGMKGVLHTYTLSEPKAKRKAPAKKKPDITAPPATPQTKSALAKAKGFLGL